jgi:hypothetical protein
LTPIRYILWLLLILFLDKLFDSDDDTKDKAPKDLNDLPVESERIKVGRTSSYATF